MTFRLSVCLPGKAPSWEFLGHQIMTTCEASLTHSRSQQVSAGVHLPGGNSGHTDTSGIWTCPFQRTSPEAFFTFPGLRDKILHLSPLGSLLSAATWRPQAECSRWHSRAKNQQGLRHSQGQQRLPFLGESPLWEPSSQTLLLRSNQ